RKQRVRLHLRESCLSDTSAPHSYPARESMCWTLGHTNWHTQPLQSPTGCLPLLTMDRLPETNVLRRRADNQGVVSARYCPLLDPRFGDSASRLEETRRALCLWAAPSCGRVHSSC